MVAEGLRDALRAHDHIEVVGGAGSARHAEELAGQLLGVVVMDYRLPDGDGATTAKRIGAGKDGPAVVTVTGRATTA